MKSIYTSKLLIVLTILIAMPVMAGAQTRRKPRLRRAAPRPAVVVSPLVSIATNFKNRLNDTLSSKETTAGDKFTATGMGPGRFNNGIVHGHIRSTVQSGT